MSETATVERMIDCKHCGGSYPQVAARCGHCEVDGGYVCICTGAPPVPTEAQPVAHMFADAIEDAGLLCSDVGCGSDCGPHDEARQRLKRVLSGLPTPAPAPEWSPEYREVLEALRNAHDYLRGVSNFYPTTEFGLHVADLLDRLAPKENGNV